MRISVILSVLSSAFGMVPYAAVAVLLGKALDNALTIEWAVSLTLVALAGYFLKHFLYSKSTLCSHKAAYEIIQNIRCAIMRKMSKMSMGTIQEKSSGEFKQLVIDDTERLEGQIAHAIPEMTASILIPIFVFAYLLFVDWRMALASLASAVLGNVIYYSMMIGRSERMKEYMSANGDMNATIVEYVNGMEVIRMFNQTASSMGRFKGAVLKVRDITTAWYKHCYGKSLGATGHHENRLIALKWADELYSTRFRGVELATTRTGMVSITGLFDPISIDGTLVSRAYLHNLDIFDEFQFGIGDEISVYKANMIIPQIADNKTQSNTYMLPMTCPCCGKPLTVKYTSGGTRQLYCGNPHCAAKLVQKFAHFCEKTRMNIEGLSATTLEKLIGHGWVRNFGDLYELEQYREDIVRTDGFGERSFDRLQAAIEKSRRCTLAKFIAGLGIPMVGRHAGRDLDRYFHGSWAEFEAAILNGFDFTQLPDFGETMHNNIYTWYADAQEAKLWRPLLRKIQFETKENLTMETTMNNPFAGKTVVATGKLEHYTRDGIQEKLISLGAHPSGAVSKKTDYLIVGEKAGSKLTKAQQLGVKTLTEQEFEDMLA